MEPIKMENYSQELEQNLLLVGHNIKDLQNRSLASRSSGTQVPYLDFDASRCVGFDQLFKMGEILFFTQPCTTVFVFFRDEAILEPIFCDLLL